MRITHLNERPSAFTAACAHAHAPSVGRLAVPGVPVSRSRLVFSPVAFNHLSMRYQSVQLQDAQLQFRGLIGRTAKGSGVTQASGVPPRGRPV